jgi:hypothetical protein
LRKKLPHFRGRADHAASTTVAGTSQEKVGQEKNVFRAFTQWRLDGNYIQAVPQVFTEGPGGNGSF